MLSKEAIEGLGPWVNEWKIDYLPREEDFTYVVGGYGIRLLRGYVPNFEVIPAGWVEAVHKPSSTKHNFYFEFKNLEVLDKVEMDKYQVDISLEYFKQEIKTACGIILGSNYVVIKASRFRLNINPSFNGFNNKIVLPSGLEIANLVVHVTPDSVDSKLIELGIVALNGLETTIRSYIVNPFHNTSIAFGDLTSVTKQIASFIGESDPTYKGKTLQFLLYGLPGAELII